MFNEVVNDGALLDRLLPREVDMDVLVGTRAARHVETREVAALAAAPAGIGTGERDGHARTLTGAWAASPPAGNLRLLGLWSANLRGGFPVLHSGGCRNSAV